MASLTDLPGELASSILGLLGDPRDIAAAVVASPEVCRPHASSAVADYVIASAPHGDIDGQAVAQALSRMLARSPRSAHELAAELLGRPSVTDGMLATRACVCSWALSVGLACGAPRALAVAEQRAAAAPWIMEDMLRVAASKLDAAMLSRWLNGPAFDGMEAAVAVIRLAVAMASPTSGGGWIPQPTLEQSVWLFDQVMGARCWPLETIIKSLTKANGRHLILVQDVLESRGTIKALVKDSTPVAARMAALAVVCNSPALLGKFLQAGLPPASCCAALYFACVAPGRQHMVNMLLRHGTPCNVAAVMHCKRPGPQSVLAKRRRPYSFQ